MAFNDILDAIVADADTRIGDATSAHKQFLKHLREESERTLLRRRGQIAEMRDQKMRQIKDKADSLARMDRNKSMLLRKQDYMNKLYNAVFASIVALPKNETETLLKHFLKNITDEGVIHPAKAHEAMIKSMLPKGCTLGAPIDAAGGFRFVSATQEHDCTYEFIVHRLLRPATEVRAATDLFPSQD